MDCRRCLGRPEQTGAYGFSRFCDLFTYEEWENFGYSIDLGFSSGAGFQSPIGVRLSSR